MRYKSWYNRRIIDALQFEPEPMRLDAQFGGQEFEEADDVLFEELRRKLSSDEAADQATEQAEENIAQDLEEFIS